MSCPPVISSRPIPGYGEWFACVCGAQRDTSPTPYLELIISLILKIKQFLSSCYMAATRLVIHTYIEFVRRQWAQIGLDSRQRKLHVHLSSPCPQIPWGWCRGRTWWILCIQYLFHSGGTLSLGNSQSFIEIISKIGQTLSCKESIIFIIFVRKQMYPPTWRETLPLDSRDICYANILEQSCQYLLLRRCGKMPDPWGIISQQPHGFDLGETAASGSLKWDLSSLHRNWTWVAWVKTRNPSC